MKEWKIELDPDAIDDLQDIHDWISDRSSAVTADRYEGRVLAFIRQLRNFPERGRARDDIARGLRTVDFEKRISIAFRIEDDRVVIIRILYAGRQVRRRLTPYPSKSSE